MPKVKSHPPRLSTLTRAWLLAVWLGSHVALGHAAVDPKAARFYEDALTRYEKRDMDGAIIQLKNALQIDKNMLSVHVLLGRALMAAGDVVAAEVAYTEALRLGVNRAEVVVSLAQALVAQGKQAQLFEQQRFSPAGLPVKEKSQLLLLRAAAHSDLGDVRSALSAIDEARALEPGAVEGWLAEVPVRVLVRQFREAAAAADKAVAMVPRSAEVHYQRGSVEHAQGHLQAALKGYDTAIGLQRNHVESLVARAGLLLDLGKVDEAARDVATLKTEAPREPRAAYLRALLAERRGDSAAARSALSDITSLLDPVPMEFIRNRPQLLTLGGLAHAGLGNNEKAKPYLEAVQKVQPGSPVAKLLARIQLGDRSTDRAIETLDSYLRVQPHDIHATALLASAHLAQGRHARATQLMLAALRAKDSPQLRTVLGMSLVGANRQDDALPEFETAFRKDPGQVQAGSAMVFLYMQARQVGKANAVVQMLLKHRPDHAGVQNLAGMVRVAAGDLAGARGAFERAARLDATFSEPQLNLARLDAGAGQPDLALKRVQVLLARDERNVDAMLEMARIVERLGQTEDAKRWLEKADDQSARDPRAALALVDFHLRGGRAEAALEANKRLTVKASDDPRALLAGARALLANGDAKGAQTRLTQANRLVSHDAMAQLEIALLQVAAKDLTGAAYSLDKALSLRPDLLAAQALMADVDLKRGDPAAAEKRAQQIVARNPKRAVGYGLLGDIALVRGNLKAAVEQYRRAHLAEPGTETLLRLFRAQLSADPGQAVRLAEQWTQSHPRDLAVMRVLGDAHAAAGRLSAARHTYEAVLKGRPDDAEVLNNLANVLLLMKDPGALKIAEAALARNPTSAHILGTVGWAAFHAGQADRALQLLRDARLRDPTNADTRYFLAEVLARAGRKVEAREELEAALRGKSTFAHAKDAENLLKALR